MYNLHLMFKYNVLIVVCLQVLTNKLIKIIANTFIHFL